MSARTVVAKGFTLVEILIVVVILGILAAIVIPQFSSASEAAKSSSLQTQLSTMRSQLELYQIQHNGAYPGRLSTQDVDTFTSATFWNQMTKQTDDVGNIDANGGLGPYMKKAVKNPFIVNTDVRDTVVQVKTVADTGDFAEDAGVTTGGFVFDPANGRIRAVLPVAIGNKLNVSYDDGLFVAEGGTFKADAAAD